MIGTKGIRAVGIIAGLILILLGALMMAKPGLIAVLFDWFIGVLFLIGGISEIFAGISAKKNGGRFIGRIIAGIAIAALGVFVVVHESTSIYIMGMIIAIFAFALAFKQIAGALELRKNKSPWIVALIFGVIHLLFGLFMIFNCFAMMGAIIIVSGIYLIIAGVMMFITSALLRETNDTTIN